MMEQLKLKLQQLKHLLIQNRVIVSTIILLIIFFFILQYQKEKYEDIENSANISTVLMQQQLKSFDSVLNTKNQFIKKQNAVILQNTKDLLNYTNEIFSLKAADERKVKEVISYTKTTSTIKIDKPILVKYTDSLEIPELKSTIDSLQFLLANSITVPREAEIDSPFYSFKQTVEKDGVLIKDVQFPDTIYGRFTIESQGLFKKDKVVYQTFNTNPYVKMKVENSSIYIPKKKKPIQKIAEIILLIGAGVLVGTTLN